jgi:23S rRNA (pseudouridine1915-N3)-methyltransferase
MQPLLVLLDSRGKLFSSEEFAIWLGRERDAGRQSIVFAIGPPSGWSEEARTRANLLLSLGPMTLPHELARVVLLEQVYRAFTILTGHPYHCGH